MKGKEKELIWELLKNLDFGDRDHSFSTFAKFSEKLSFYPLGLTRNRAHQGVRNVSFSNIWDFIIAVRLYGQWLWHDFMAKALKQDQAVGLELNRSAM